MEAPSMEKLEILIRNAMREADEGRDQARLNQLKSPEFLTLATTTILSLISLFHLLSASQIQHTAAWQFFTVWGCMILSMVWSILAVYAPDRIGKFVKKRA
jgi:hypothetical protein